MADLLDAFERSLERSASCDRHPPLSQVRTVEEGLAWEDILTQCPPANRLDHLRWFARNDLYMLLTTILRRPDLRHPWFLARCLEVQAQPDGCLDFWSRFAGKSSIITFGLTFQDMFREPEWTHCIFSHTKPNAKEFLRLIKLECEQNVMLPQLAPHIFYTDPKRLSPCWSEDKGLTMKRQSNLKEATVEAWGLVDGQPTGSHFDVRVYDDVIDMKFVHTEYIVEKVNKEWENSNLLGAGPRANIHRVVGTFYSDVDTYALMRSVGYGTERIRPTGYEGLYAPRLTPEDMAALRRIMSPRTFALQILLSLEQAASHLGFQMEWLLYYDQPPPLGGMSVYLLVDPAGGKKSSHSFTAMWVIGLYSDKRIYILDGACGHYGLAQRKDLVFKFVKQYGVRRVFYETYGFQSDTEYMRLCQQQDNLHFTIQDLGGHDSKTPRIQDLQADFGARRILLPKAGILQTNPNGEVEDIVKTFVEKEYKVWMPELRTRNDQLDALARLKDPKVIEMLDWPRPYTATGEWALAQQLADDGGTWMSE